MVGPFLTNITNIATCNPAYYHAIRRYFTVVSLNATKDNPALFYTVGGIQQSDLFTVEKFHQICVVPSDLVWNHGAALMGKIFNKSKLAFSTFYNDISVSTLIKYENINPTTRGGQLSTFGMSTSTSSKQMMTIQNAPLSYDTDGK